MDLRGYLQAIRRSWWLVVVAVIVGAATGFLTILGSSAQYASTVTFFVQTRISNSGDSAYSADQFGQKRINTYVQLMSSNRFAQMVIDATQTNLTPQQVIGEISSRADLNTVLLTATVTDESQARSLQIAKAVSTEFVKLVTTFETVPGATKPTVFLTVSSGPTLNTTPVSPRVALDLALGVAIGLIVGLALAILRDVLDTSVRTSDVLRKTAHYPMLGVIGYDSMAKKSPLIVDSHARSIRAEAFRQLRTNLQFVDVDAPARVIVVSSSVAGEGKSTTAANLAVTFAEAGHRVLLVEADLRRPRISDYLGLEGSVGLTNVLAGQVDITDVLQPWGRGGLTVLPSGSIPPNPSELLGSNNFLELLAALKSKFDTIILDTPPLLPVTDGAVVAAHADGAVLVVRQGKTGRAQVTAALRALEAVDARILGTVLNMASVKSSGAYAYSYDAGLTDGGAPGQGSSGKGDLDPLVRPASGDPSGAAAPIGSRKSTGLRKPKAAKPIRSEQQSRSIQSRHRLIGGGVLDVPAVLRSQTDPPITAV